MKSLGRRHTFSSQSCSSAVGDGIGGIGGIGSAIGAGSPLLLALVEVEAPFSSLCPLWPLCLSASSILFRAKVALPHLPTAAWRVSMKPANRVLTNLSKNETRYC